VGEDMVRLFLQFARKVVTQINKMGIGVKIQSGPIGLAKRR
jgi:hypothetical protein